MSSAIGIKSHNQVILIISVVECSGCQVQITRFEIAVEPERIRVLYHCLLNCLVFPQLALHKVPTVICVLHLFTEALESILVLDIVQLRDFGELKWVCLKLVNMTFNKSSLHIALNPWHLHSFIGICLMHFEAILVSLAEVKYFLRLN